jgi:hypothetical protein
VTSQLWERTGQSHEKQYAGQRLHLEFADRLNKAADLNPNVPPLRSGRLTYIQDEMEKRGMTVSLETVRKWFSGESMPHKSRWETISEILKVDQAWLIHGTEDVTPSERRLRNAMADGAVNFVAGLMQMDGATVAFPDDGDRYAIQDHIDLTAIIRGASYAIHVIVAEERDSGPVFSVPTELRHTVPIGVVRHEGFNFSVYEITDMAIGLGKPGRTGRIEVDIREDGVREIESFRDRF